MKKSLSKVVLAAMIATVPLAADNYSYDTYSLFAIEGGATNVDIERNDGANVDIDKTNLPNIGLKIGAQGNDFRAFLSARYYNADDFSKLMTAGGELQYLFNFSKAANFFIGANAGQAFIKVGADSDKNIPSMDTTSMYYGGDAGFNIHATELIDIEIGAKYMALDVNENRDDGTGTSTLVNFKMDSMVTAYASVIFKWQMN